MVTRVKPKKRISKADAMAESDFYEEPVAKSRKPVTKKPAARKPAAKRKGK